MFTSGIQTPMQLEIMQKFGHGNVVSFDATFGINQSKVCPFCYCMKCHIINMFHNIVTNVGVMLFTIPFVHPNGVWNGKMGRWLHSLSLEKVKKMTLTQFFEHYQNVCQATGCLMLF